MGARPVPGWFLASIALFALTIASASNAQPDPKSLTGVGKRVAARYCGECHAVEPGALSRLSDAPPMPELYRRFPVERMGEALELGMMDNHPRMPNFIIDPDEREALTAYLSSFAPPKPRKRSPWWWLSPRKSPAA